MPILTIQNSKQIYYEMFDGGESLPYLVFLHEGLGCIGMWKDFPRLLCKETGCPGLAYDRRGYGKSSGLAEPMTIHFMHRSALVELPAIIDRLIPGRDFILIGHSDGGSISLIFASEKPVRLKGTITEGAHVFVERKTTDSIRAAVDDFNAGGLTGLFKYHGDKTKGIFKAWSDVWLSNGFGFWNIEYVLPSIASPLLALQGTEDPYGTEAQIESIAAKTPNCRKVMIENCRHIPHLESAEATLRAMKEFIGAVL